MTGNAPIKLSIVIPRYDEINSIRPIIVAVRSSPVERKEIIVVDDCSTDGNRFKLSSLMKRKKLVSNKSH